MQALSALSSDGAGARAVSARIALQIGRGESTEDSHRAHRAGGVRHTHRHANEITEAGAAERLQRGESHGPARAELRLRVEQTFRTLAGAADRASGVDAGAEPAESENGSASLSARVRISASEGRVDARVRLDLSFDGTLDAAGLAQALEGFTQALFGALHALFGQPQSASAPALPEGNGGESAAATAAAAAAAAPAEAIAAAPAPGAAGALTTTAAAQPAAAPATDEPAAAAAPASAHISIRVRITYGSQGGFQSALPGLVQQLAQPAEDQPQTLAPMLADLGQALQRLWSYAPAGAAMPTLGGFLGSLARNWAQPERAEAGSGSLATVEPPRIALSA